MNLIKTFYLGTKALTFKAKQHTCSCKCVVILIIRNRRQRYCVAFDRYKVDLMAGIMWSSILNEHDLSFKYLDFLKMGVTVAIPTLIVALISLSLFII